VTNWKRYLLEEGAASEEELELIDLEAKDEVNDAIEFAKSSRPPRINELTEDVYWEVDEKTEASRQGRYFF
jgi:pyruvate dehydrogenase E1 component alpha subunit